MNARINFKSNIKMAAEEKTYRSINTIKKILSLLVENIPVIESDLPLYLINKKVKESFLSFLREESEEYCLNLDKFPQNIDASGGGGAVSKFIIKEGNDRNEESRRIYVDDVSFPSFGSFTPFNNAVIIKSNLFLESLIINIMKFRNGRLALISNVQFHEVLVGSLFSYIVDLDICPHLTKYYGVYLCQKDKYSLIEESSDITLRDLIKDYRNQIIYPDLQIFLFQILYTIYIEKKVCGALNYDLHTKNVMFQLLKNNLFNLETTTSDPVIQGIQANQADYFAYEFKINDKYYEIITENLGLLTKIVDYGFVFVDLAYSEIDSYYNLNFPLSLMNYSTGFGTFADIHYDRYKYFDSHEFCFLLLNLFLDFDVIGEKFNFEIKNKKVKNQRDIDNYNSANPIKNKLWEFILFLNNLFGYDQNNIFATEMNLEQIREFITKNPERWFFNYRKVGLENVKIESLLLFYIEMLRRDRSLGSETRILPGTNQPYTVERFILNSRKPYNPKAKIISISALKGSVSPINPIKNFMRDFHKAYESKFKFTDRNEDQYLKIDPRNEIEKPLLSNETIKYDNQKCKIEKLEGQELIKTDFFTLKFLNIEPENLDLGNCYAPEFRIQDYHSAYHPDLNLTKEKKSLQSNIHIDYLEIDIEKSNISFIYSTNSLFEESQEQLFHTDHGLAFNLGYFIVMQNVNNLLTNHYNLTPSDTFKPIGFFYYKDARNNGTLLQIPVAYQKYFAVILIQKDNSISMERYDQFLDRHQCEDILELLMTEVDGENSFIPIINRKIKLEKGKPKIKSGSEYKYATTTGPIAIWQNKIELTDSLFEQEFVFTRKEFRIASPEFTRNILYQSTNRKKADYIRYRLNYRPEENTRFKVVDSAEDYKMFSSTDEGPFIYGQRLSFRINIYSTIAIKDNKLYYFLLEGRGFSTLGADRIQLTKILAAMNLDYMVFADGGFSANAIVKKDGEIKSLIQDAEGRRLPSICIIK